MVPDKEPFDHERHLNSSSLTVTTDRGAGLVLELWLVKTKTNQLGAGQVQAVSCVCPQVPHEMCPVHVDLALRAQHSSITFGGPWGYYCSRQVTSMVPLFQCRKEQTLRRPHVVKAIKWLVGQLGCGVARLQQRRHDFQQRPFSSWEAGIRTPGSGTSSSPQQN